MLVVMTTREWLFFLRAWLNRHLIAIYTKQTPTWKHKIQYTHSATYVGLSSWICVNKSLQSGFRSSDMCIKCFCTNKSHRIRCGNVICIYKKWLTERDRVGECVSASVWRERRMLLIFTICNFTICRWWKWWNFLYFPADMFFLSLKLALSLALIFHRYKKKFFCIGFFDHHRCVSGKFTLFRLDYSLFGIANAFIFVLIWY